VWLDDHRTALYRFFDEGGALLYVGITANVEGRFAHHEQNKEWWPQVAEKTIDWFDTRPPARAAELQAIHDERPVYNINGSPWAAGRRELEPQERTVGQIRSNLTEQIQRVRYTGEAVVVVDSTKARRPVAAIVPFDFYERALESLGETAALAVDS
jgi:antitoxin (DNA-binding transcriptional repressor) of toxin-antitoxin stability system